MRKYLWLGILPAALATVGASAQPAPAPNPQDAKIAWAQFVDPTESAFALQVPQGWVVKGGINRVSPITVTAWVTATSPDGAIQVFIGDPSIPTFRVPPANQPEGTQLQPASSQLPPTVALNYRAGASFAQLYAPNSLATAGCTGATPTGTQAEPAIAQQSYARAVQLVQGIRISGTYTPPQHDAGLATFTCTSGGRTYAAGVIADTARPAAINMWTATVAGYLTTPDQADWALAILQHMLASRQWNPQWDQAMRDAAQDAINRQNQEDAQVEAQLVQQSWQFTNMLLAAGNADQQARNASHNAFMAQMQAQSVQRNAQFQQYEAQRSLNSWQFDAYIRNGALYRDTTTGRIFEVDQ